MTVPPWALILRPERCVDSLIFLEVVPLHHSISLGLAEKSKECLKMSGFDLSLYLLALSNTFDAETAPEFASTDAMKGIVMM